MPVEVLERIIDAAIREDDGGGGELEEERFLLLFPHRIEDVHREKMFRSSDSVFLCFSGSPAALPFFSFFFSYLIVCEHSI